MRPILAMALVALPLGLSLPGVAAAQTDPKSVTCADFLAMSDADKAKAVAEMHAVSPDAAMAMDEAAVAQAVAKTTSGCEANGEQTAYAAMTAQ
ncbi:MAG: hypothetical protein KGK00_15025 [Paracoccaceae bacterium]|nr:hypothetical protein [Paracoccaceae bacterium]MDE3237813.1 hypothetical protein [Paracoccaceae bacterium]